MDHSPWYGRTKLGKRTYATPRGAAGQYYGTTVRCSCGWRERVNQAPSNGGRRRASELFDQHVSSAQAEHLADT